MVGTMAHAPVHGLETLEVGLHTLHRSQLWNFPEFKGMWNAIDRHYNDLKLAHLTGKAKDLQTKAVHDTKFYNILTKMLCEVEGKRTGKRQSLQRVYTWYMANKHVLYCGPHFGREKIKQEAKEILRKATTPRSQMRAKSAMERKINTPQLSSRSARRTTSTPRIRGADTRGRLSGGRAPPPSFRLDLEYMLGEDPYRKPRNSLEKEESALISVPNQDTLGMSACDADDESDDGGPVPHSASPSPTRVLTRPKTSSTTRFASARDKREPAKEETTPRTLQRMVHPIPSYINPHTALAKEMSPVDPDSIKPSGVIRILSGKGSSSDQLRAWQNYYKERAIGQEHRAHLRLAGRSGTASDVRYTAHNFGETPEIYTESVLRHLSGNLDFDSPQLSPKDAVDEENTFMQHTLEEFYERADAITANLRSTPRMSAMQRIKSAPAKHGNSESAHQHSTATLVNSNTKLTQQSEDASKSPDPSAEPTVPVDTGVKLNTVINVIDSVSDDMAFFKEKVAPDPQPGFRQPLSTGLPTPRDLAGSTLGLDVTQTSGFPSPRLDEFSERGPMTSPVGSPFASRTLGVRESMSESGRPRQGRCSSAGVLDWRGRIKPDTLRYKWSKTKFGGHTYLKKWYRPSSRSAGGVTGKTRPKTAPTSTREKWKTEKESDKNRRAAQAASHGTTEVEQDDVDTMVTIQPLLTDAERSGSMDSLLDMDEAFWRNLRRSRPTSGPDPPVMEFLSFITPTAAAIAEQRAKLSTSLEQDKTEDENREAAKQKTETTASVTEEPISIAPIHVPDPNYNVDALDAAVIEEHLSQTAADVNDVTTDRTEGQTTQREENPEKQTIKEEETEGLLTQREEGQKSPSEKEASPPRDRPQSSKTGSHVEVRFVPPEGGCPIPTSARAQPLQELSQSEQWNYSLGAELSEDLRYSDHFCDVQLDPEGDPRDSMTSKVQRSAGRMPTQTQSARCVTSHMLAYSRRYSDTLRRAPPLRTPPSIPTPASGGRRATTSRGGNQGGGGLMMAELERHARKARSPRSLMHTVNTLRSEDNARPMTEGDTDVTADTIVGMTLQVCRLPTSSRGRWSQMSTDTDFDFNAQLLQSLADHPLSREPSMLHSIHEGPQDSAPCPPTRQGPAPSRRWSSQTTRKITTAPGVARTGRGDDLALQRNSTWTGIGSRLTRPGHSAGIDSRTVLVGRPFSKVGRPIAQCSKIPDPDELFDAVVKQKEAAAAVDIQRIFRGYVARNVYKNLLSEEIQKKEDERRAAIKIQSIYRGHMSRKLAIYNRPALNPDLVKWSKDVKAIQEGHSQRRQIKVEARSQEISENHRAACQKISTIGPHVEVYDIYHPKKTGPTKRELYQAAVKIQKVVRGWMVRRKMEKLSRKATWYGSNFPKMVKEYKTMLRRVQQQHGVDKASTPFSIRDMNNYIDTRRRYESVFEKKSFGGELEHGDIEAFFRECDLYPSQAEIEEALDVTMHGQKAKREGQGLKKKELLDMIFYIYTPTATGLQGKTRQSTWMSPIIEGQEARKLLGSEFVEPAPLAPCAKLVIDTKREQRLREQAQKEEEERRRINETKEKLAEGEVK